MHRMLRPTFALVLFMLATSACEQIKSSNPLSPAIAGPIAGVEISAPGPVSPAANQRVASDTQPLTLTVNNAVTNGVRPLSYVFEIATDLGFTNKVFTKSGIPPGENGQTSLRLPDPLQSDRIYYWRVKAQDGANTGDFSPPMAFVLFTPVVIGMPQPTSPANGATLTTLQPTLEVQNASVSGPATPIVYRFVVATDPGMGNVVMAEEAPAGNGRTSRVVPFPLQPATRYYWRAIAFDAGHQGPWSPIWSFVTGAAAAPPTGGGGGGAPPTSAANDEIDVKTIVIALGEDIRGWAVTSTVTSAGHVGGDICIDHTKAGRWPQLPWFGDPNVPVEGNQWFFAKIGGQWIGGANEWLRPGQTCKPVDGHVGQGGFGGTALANWTPAPGEVVGVAVSTPARAGQWGTAERSNIVLIRW